MTINKLDPVTISRIAAGEVVERPASVVKELVENAIDAGATQITVEIKGGGIDLIRVTDNGSGIPSDEVEFAFQRYTTSKIHTTADLDAINTLGFRGEALASIAAVADVDILTRTAKEIAGYSLSLRKGKVTDHRVQSRMPGTTLSVRSLFHNVPARLKFLKSTATENGHITNVVSQYALAYPEIRFTLYLEGRQILKTSGNNNLIEVIHEIYGDSVSANMIPVASDNNIWLEKSCPDIKIAGMIGSPSIARSSRNYLSFFVNRRWVTSKQLSWAVEEAFHGMLMQDKHPIAVINIRVPPDRVDVNIHPAKTEVRFSDERAVYTVLQKAVRNALTQKTPVPRIDEMAIKYTGKHETENLELWKNDISSIITALPENSTHIIENNAPLPILRILGQVAGNYIVTEGQDGLYIIDQHAAHERIRYEVIEKQRATGSMVSQGLLEPAVFECSPEQAQILAQNLPDISKFGFQIEPFGERTFLVRSIPEILNNGDWIAALREILDNIYREKNDVHEENLIKSLACHSAVRAGQILSNEEMKELIRQLEQVKMPRTCPHGRPTVIQISIKQLEKNFGRI